MNIDERWLLYEIGRNLKDDDLKYILDAYEVYKQKTMELLNKQMMDSIG